jgi:lipopolysaccharide/colanic/teichoic acid biosynthesis glycosyltransferase
VGPRPEVPRYVEFYPASIRDDCILYVPPGITDLASIEFKDENTLLTRINETQRKHILRANTSNQAYVLLRSNMYKIGQ